MKTYKAIYILNLHLPYDEYHNLEDFISDYSFLDVQKIAQAARPFKESILEFEVMLYQTMLVIEESQVDGFIKSLRHHKIFKKHIDIEDYEASENNELVLSYEQFSSLQDYSLESTHNFWQAWENYYF